MHDQACVDFLQWALPKLRKRWPGFRKVRGQVCKRIARRMQALELPGLDAYRAYLDDHPDEWDRLDALCRITISRFYRDHGVFERLRVTVLPVLAEAARRRDAGALHAWSAGCASGEEAYTLTILWRLTLAERFPDLALALVATDAGAHMLDRARRGCYQRGTLNELPGAWIDAAFTRNEDSYCIRSPYRTGITWRQQDIRQTMPDGPFDLILCRNLVFTYFTEPLQRACLDRMAERLHPGGALILGAHETLPDNALGFTAWDEDERIYRKT